MIILSFWYDTWTFPIWQQWLVLLWNCSLTLICPV